MIKKKIWVIYPKKPMGKPKISYNDVVEESLCFSWIDSTVKTSDERDPRFKSWYLTHLTMRNNEHEFFIPKGKKKL
jgi:hypothetical protein